MSIEEEFLANAKDGVPGFAIAYALLRVAESIRDGCENIALALDRLAPPDEVAVAPLGSVDLKFCGNGLNFCSSGPAGMADAARAGQSSIRAGTSIHDPSEPEQGER